jgi:hypothetical protein
MNLPFTPEQFFDVFRQYNDAVFPAQGLLIAAAVFILVLAGFGSNGRSIYVLLACLWLWMGVVYHLMFFCRINPAALIFGTLFVTQGVIFLIAAWRRPRVEIQRNVAGVVGVLVAAYALIAYPALAYALGQRYPATPTFGLPCPTTIFTFAVLLWTQPPRPIWAWAVPALWAIVGTSAAIQLSVFEDYGLPIAGLSAAWLVALRRPDARVTPQRRHRGPA